MFFGASTGAEWDLYVKVGKLVGDDEFTYFHTEEACAKIFQTTAPGLTIIRSFDEPIVPYTGQMDIKSVTAFM